MLCTSPGWPVGCTPAQDNPASDADKTTPTGTPPLTPGQWVTLVSGISGAVVSIVGGIITLQTQGGQTIQAPVSQAASVTSPPVTTSEKGFFDDPAFIGIALGSVAL